MPSARSPASRSSRGRWAASQIGGPPGWTGGGWFGAPARVPGTSAPSGCANIALITSSASRRASVRSRGGANGTP